MRVPDEFERLVRGGFHQDSLEDVSSGKEWVANAVQFLTSDQRIVVGGFLDALLASNPTGQQLIDMWDGASPDYTFGDPEELRVLLGMIRDAVR